MIFASTINQTIFQYFDVMNDVLPGEKNDRKTNFHNNITNIIYQLWNKYYQELIKGIGRTFQIKLKIIYYILSIALMKWKIEKYISKDNLMFILFQKIYTKYFG